MSTEGQAIKFPPTDWTVGHRGEGSIGPFVAYHHETGFDVYFFEEVDIVVCYRAADGPEWHRAVMDSLKNETVYPAAVPTGNTIDDITLFLSWVGCFQIPRKFPEWDDNK